MNTLAPFNNNKNVYTRSIGAHGKFNDVRCCWAGFCFAPLSVRTLAILKWGIHLGFRHSTNSYKWSTQHSSHSLTQAHTRNTHSQLDHLHFDRTNMFHDAWCARVETIHSSESHFAFLFKNSLSLADSYFAKMLETPHQSYLIAVPPKKAYISCVLASKERQTQSNFIL